MLLAVYVEGLVILFQTLIVSGHIHVSDNARMSNCSSAMRSWIIAERRMAEWTLKVPKLMVVGFDVRFLNCTLQEDGPGLLSMSPDSNRRNATTADDRERQRWGRKGRPVRGHNKIPVM